MLENKKIIIEKLPKGKFKITWHHKPYTDEDDFGNKIKISSSSTTCDDEYDLLAMLINPFEIDFYKLENESIRMHVPDLTPEWLTMKEYCEQNNLTRMGVYDRIRRKEVEKRIVKGRAFVKDKE